jgi:hypothetical protein
MQDMVLLFFVVAMLILWVVDDSSGNGLRIYR